MMPAAIGLPVFFDGRGSRWKGKTIICLGQITRFAALLFRMTYGGKRFKLL